MLIVLRASTPTAALSRLCHNNGFVLVTHYVLDAFSRTKRKVSAPMTYTICGPAANSRWDILTFILDYWTSQVYHCSLCCLVSAMDNHIPVPNFNCYFVLDS